MPLVGSGFGGRCRNVVEFLTSLLREYKKMLAKVTAKNQITLPKAIVSQFPGVEYFEVRADGQKIVLEPVRHARTGEVWERLEQLGITESDVADAVKWARKGRAGRRA